jgi:uncharacterized protein (DUF427 family)
MTSETTVIARSKSGSGTAEGKTILFEPAQRRVRGFVGDMALVDTVRAMLMLESGHLPVYYIPREDVRLDLLERTAHATHCPYKGDATYWSVVGTGRQIENAAWSYEAPIASAPQGLAGMIAFYANLLDRWIEEDEVVIGHPRNPYHRVDTLHSMRHVQVRAGGTIIADSRDAVFLFETGLPVRYYLPRADVRADLLGPSQRHTICPYKGVASYHSVSVDGTTLGDLVWYYPDPLPESVKIAGRLAFYNEKVDAILVDGERVGGKVGVPAS